MAMAILIPDSCPSKATVGEKRVFGFLRDTLPDHFTAWYEPNVAGRYPDFTLAAFDFGLLMLEVKGWYVGQIVRADDNEVELHRIEGSETRVERHKHPALQVREYVLALMDELRRPEFAILRHAEGAHQGKPCFPFGYGVLLTNITRAQLDETKLSPLFPPERTLCRDDMAALEGAGDRAVIRRLKRLFSVNFPFDPLTRDQVNTLKGALHREVVVKLRPATAASVSANRPLPPGSVALDVLDASQEQVVRSIGSGHQVIFGIAGSGKSVLVTSRARLIATQDPTKKVLILCYNKVLAASMAAQFAGDPAMQLVEIRTFHSWAARKTRMWNKDYGSFEDYEKRLVTSLLEGIDQFAESDKYDAMLIDEAQDFQPEWLRCATGFLKGGPEGDMVIAVDGAQSLYGRPRSFTWKSVGVQAHGRSRRLSRNYRNTKQIVEFAWQVAQAYVKDAGESETCVRLLPSKASRQGPMPVYRDCQTFSQEHALIARLVAHFKGRGLAEQDIAVLYERNESNRVDALCRVLRQTCQVCWLSNDADPNGGVRSLKSPGVRLLTIKAAKGLEFPAVIVSAADQLPSWMDPDEVRDSNLFYVALTRAADHLAVTWVGSSAFTDRVLRSNKATLLS
jgi:UvrD-like helicase C-terminal domain/AAA domain